MTWCRPLSNYTTQLLKDTLLRGGSPDHRIDHLRKVRNAACSYSFSLGKSANDIRVQTHVLKAGVSRENYGAVVKS